MTFEDARQIALQLPGVEDGQCYRMPALRVRGRLIARLQENGEDMIVRMERDLRAVLMRVRPQVFHFDEDFAKSCWVMLRLPNAEEEEVREQLEESWRSQAPKKLVAEYDAARAGGRAQDGNRTRAGS